MAETQQKTAINYYEDIKNVVRDQSSQIRLPEFILFACLIFGTDVGLGLPLNQLIVIVICLYGVTRKPMYDLKPLGGLIALFIVMLSYIAAVSFFADPTVDAADWKRRLLRLVLTTVLMFLLASGQLHLRSAIFGYTAAILVNIPLFYAGLAPDTYGGYLTGLVGDKNVAGLVYCLFGILLLSMMVKRWQRITVFIVFAAALWFTGSRTSLAAFAMAIVWILLAPKLPVIGRFILAGLMYVVINILSEDYSHVGEFADRVGTDMLRERIDDAAWVRVQETGFFGQGLGEAYVRLEDQLNFFFHNSYWSAFVEGGWLWAIFLVAVTVFVLVRPFSDRTKWSPQQLVAQGLGIALLICSLRLGEVFFTLYWGICMGFGLRVWLAEKPENMAKLETARGLDQEIVSTGVGR